MAAFALGSASNLGASILTCSLNGGGAPTNGCYTGTSFSANDFLDWGSALGEAIVPLTQAIAPSAISGQTNPHDASTPWNAASNSGFGVSVSSAQNSGTSDIARIDNTLDAWNGSYWDLPSNVSQTEYGENILTFAGHFGSPTAAGLPAGTQFGDHLIGATDGSGNLSPADLFLNFATTITSVGFRISTNGSSNSNFGAIVTAMNATGGVIGTYSIQDQGAGGICDNLTPTNRWTAPGTCDDAPWIGFIDPNGQIASLTIDAFDPNSGASLAFVIDTLELNTTGDPAPVPIPEPATIPMAGGVLAALAGLARKRAHHSR